MICFNPSQHLLDFLEETPLSPLIQNPIWLPDHFDRFEHFSPNWNDPIADHLDLLGGNHTEVEDSPFDVRTAVIDPDDDALVIPEVGNSNPGIKRELLVGSSAVLRSIMLSIGRQPPNPTSSVKGSLPSLYGDRFGIIESPYARGR